MARVASGESLALVEVQGMATAIKVADAMCDAAAVRLEGISHVSPLAMSVVARGEVGAARAAADAGAAVAGPRLTAVHVIPAPDPQLEPLIPDLARHRPGGRVSRRLTQPIEGSTA